MSGANGAGKDGVAVSATPRADAHVIRQETWLTDWKRLLDEARAMEIELSALRAHPPAASTGNSFQEWIEHLSKNGFTYTPEEIRVMGTAWRARPIWNDRDTAEGAGLREALECITHYAECIVEKFSSGRPSLDMTLLPILCERARAALATPSTATEVEGDGLPFDGPKKYEGCTECGGTGQTHLGAGEFGGPCKTCEEEVTAEELEGRNIEHFTPALDQWDKHVMVNEDGDIVEADETFVRLSDHLGVVKSFAQPVDGDGETPELREALEIVDRIAAQTRVRHTPPLFVAAQRLAAAYRATRRSLERRLRFYMEREKHFARVLGVSDMGQYRNDWDAKLRELVEERDRLRPRRSKKARGQ